MNKLESEYLERRVAHPLLDILHECQERYGYIPPELVASLAAQAGKSVVEMWEAITFYHFFRTEPLGKHYLRLPLCPANVVHGAEAVHLAVMAALGFTEKHVAPEGVYTTPEGDVSYEAVSCSGRCYLAPYILVDDTPVPLGRDDPVAATLELVKKLRSDSYRQEPVTPAQPRITEVHRRVIRKILAASPEELLGQVEDAGLRGRGGAAFPAGKKWRTARDNAKKLAERMLARGEFTAFSDVAYVVANHDEGEPCTNKDEDLSLKDAVGVLIGMLLCGRAIGAIHGVVYVRYEYPHVYRVYKDAIRLLREEGLFGSNIMGSPQHFMAEVVRGGGSYPTGESSGLVRSIMGLMRPRKTQRLSVKGLWDKPTVVSNVETLASAVDIVSEGPDVWKAKGCPRRFSLTGAVARPGVIIAPENMSLAELVARAGGPVGDVLGVIPGGASTALLRDMTQSASGTGAVTVVNSDTDPTRLAHWIAWFFWRESCGGCLACPAVTRALLDITATPAGFCSACNEHKLQELNGSAQVGQCGMLWPSVEPIMALYMLARKGEAQ